MAQTRKSTRVIIPTTKAKQFQETFKKPILRSINTVDEDENTYNKLSFKKRKTSPSDKNQNNNNNTNNNNNDNHIPKASVNKKKDTKKEQLLKKRQNDLQSDGDEGDELTFSRGTDKNSIDEEEEEEEEEDFLSYNDDENLFNSDDDAEYYSAISDYEQDSQIKPPSHSYYSKSFLQDKVDKKVIQSNTFFNHHHNPSTHSLLNSSLFDHEDTTDTSEVNSPIHPSFNFSDNVQELKSLEENFQRIIDENEKSQQINSLELKSNSINNSDSETTQSSGLSDQSTPVTLLSTSSASASSTFIDYLSEDISSDESPQSQSTSNKLMTSGVPKFLQYRHDERHNLAFPDVSTFPIRYDPSSITKVLLGGSRKNKVRALKRRAIVSGKATEMVGVGLGMTSFEFDF